MHNKNLKMMIGLIVLMLMVGAVIFAVSLMMKKPLPIKAAHGVSSSEKTEDAIIRDTSGKTQNMIHNGSSVPREKRMEEITGEEVLIDLSDDTEDRTVQNISENKVNTADGANTLNQQENRVPIEETMSYDVLPAADHYETEPDYL